MAASDILIVEDNDVNVLILRAMLRKSGYEPLVALDGMAGLAMVEAHRPRLVLMDLQMPRMDGFAAAAEIFRRFGAAAPAVIAVTANVTDQVLADCERAGFVDVISKPLILDDLAAMVSRHLAPR